MTAESSVIACRQLAIHEEAQTLLKTEGGTRGQLELFDQRVIHAL
jgi:hypothetical protein